MASAETPVETVHDIATKSAAKRYKMSMNRTEYNVDFGGRLPAGAVVLADEATAIRWYEHDVASPADPDAPTYAEEKRRIKRDEFLAQAQPAEGVYDQAMTRYDQQQDNRPLMREMPARGRGRPRRSASDPLAGAEVVTDVEEDED